MLNMVNFEQTVWTQYALRDTQERPAASHISAILSGFSTIFQRPGATRDDMGFVFRLAECRRHWMSGSDTSGQLVQLHVPPSTVATNIDGVSAAERLVLTPERAPDAIGKVVLVYEHGNFSDKDQVSWGYDVRQDHQPPHTQLLTQDDLDFEKFIESDGPVPTKDVGKFWERKYAELPNEPPEWAEEYTKPDSLRTRYQRLKKRKARMGLSS